MKCLRPFGCIVPLQGFEHHCWRTRSKTPSKLFSLVPKGSPSDLTRPSRPCCPTRTHRLGFHFPASVLCSRLGLPPRPRVEEADRCPRSRRLNTATPETQVFGWEELLQSRTRSPSVGPALENTGQEFCVPSLTGFSELFNDPVYSPKKETGVFHTHCSGKSALLGFSTPAAESRSVAAWAAGPGSVEEGKCQGPEVLVWTATSAPLLISCMTCSIASRSPNVLTSKMRAS